MHKPTFKLLGSQLSPEAPHQPAPLKLVLHPFRPVRLFPCGPDPTGATTADATVEVDARPLDGIVPMLAEEVAPHLHGIENAPVITGAALNVEVHPLSTIVADMAEPDIGSHTSEQSELVGVRYLGIVG